MTWQSDIFHSVTQRGYGPNDMTTPAYAISQIAKLVEEVEELLQCFRLDSVGSGEMHHGLSLAANSASYIFNRADRIGHPYVNLEMARKELADCAVVVAMLAEILECDVLAEASRKASGDVKRGVRIPDVRK